MPTGRDALRMMQKMGMNVNELENVEEVLIKTTDKTVIIEKPNVTLITMQGQNMYQVAGGFIKEAATDTHTILEITEEDIKLVVEQTGKTLDEAKKALEEADGDLAKAILKLKGA